MRRDITIDRRDGRPPDRRDSRQGDPRWDPRNPNSNQRRPNNPALNMPLIPFGPPPKPDIAPPPPKPPRVPDPIAEPGTSNVQKEAEREAEERQQQRQRRRADVVPEPARKKPARKAAKEPRMAPHQICKVLYADDDLVVVDKMAGLPVNPSGGFRERSVVRALHALGYDPVFPISLLDTEASGLVVLSRSADAAHALRWNWRSSLCERQYVAVVTGDIPGAGGKIAVAVGAVRRGQSIRHEALPVEAGGRTGTTEWKLLARGRGMTRVLCTLKHGRTHQIRIHFATVGFPVVGDRNYGASQNDVPLEALVDLPGRSHEGPHIAQGTVALHCTRIRMPHPMTQQPMDWQSPVPRRLTSLMPGAWTPTGIGRE